MRQYLVLTALVALFLCNVAAETESQIRHRLGIPSNAKRVLILSQSSHMDWDWNETFMDYYNSKVDSILTSATTVLATYASKTHPYYYSIAETGFLQEFWEKHPNQLNSLRQSNHTLHMVGGGITSPDSLLNHGEAFIRNFLVGQQALRSVSLPTMTNIWIPDDFGHDGQLPVMVRAMGLGAASFARVPGANDQGPAAARLDGSPSTAQILLNEGVDFTWSARDGSQIFAHWLQDHYNQGDNIDSGTMGNPSDCSSFSTPSNAKITNGHITRYIQANGPSAVSPYMFVAIGDDFTSPKSCLLTYVQNWNSMVFGSPEFNSDVFVVSATFDHYAALVKAHTSNSTNQRPLRVRQFEPTPYWTGFYASRPELKIMQERAMRNAIAAETLVYITRSYQQWGSLLSTCWSHLAPSTHHDFITGTSPDPVYNNEQIPYMNKANLAATTVASGALLALGSTLTTDAIKGQETGILLFNSLGYARTNATLLIPGTFAPNGTRSFFDGKRYQPIHREEDGTVSTFVSYMDPLSYMVGKLSNQSPQGSTPQVRLRILGDLLILENAHIQVTLSKSAHYAATSILDKSTGQELIQTSARDPGAFHLEILKDMGNIYRFANEMDGCLMGNTSYPIIGSSIQPKTIRSSAVHVSIQMEIQFDVDGQTIYLHRTYSLYEHDRMIRVQVNGSAPRDTSVFMRTPLTFMQPMVSYGTPYHYDTHMPAAYWTGYNFMAIHNFFTLTSLDGLTVGFYTSTLRAWALDGTTVVTALLRNTPGGVCRGYGADGSDYGTHEVELALRIPSGLSAAPSITPLKESLDYTTPIIVGPMSQYSTRSSAPYSLLSLTPNAIVTTAKPSETDPKKLVVRIYTPSASTTTPATVILTTALNLASQSAVRPITALENPLAPGETSVSVNVINNHHVALTVRAALITILISPSP